MKPGKPTTFATCNYRGKKKYCLCLPGNPVSAIVIARLFLLPLLHHMQGVHLEPIIVQAEVCDKTIFKDDTQKKNCALLVLIVSRYKCL